MGLWPDLGRPHRFPGAPQPCTLRLSCGHRFNQNLMVSHLYTMEVSPSATVSVHGGVLCFLRFSSCLFEPISYRAKLMATVIHMSPRSRAYTLSLLPHTQLNHQASNQTARQAYTARPAGITKQSSVVPLPCLVFPARTPIRLCPELCPPCSCLLADTGPSVALWGLVCPSFWETSNVKIFRCHQSLPVVNQLCP